MYDGFSRDLVWHCLGENRIGFKTRGAGPVVYLTLFTLVLFLYVPLAVLENLTGSTKFGSTRHVSARGISPVLKRERHSK